MYNLISANFMRLKKDKIFWISFVFLFAAGIFIPVMRYMDMIQTDTINYMDHGFFGCALFISIIMAVFCSLFTGTEYSDGTMRNKIIVGQRRTDVYLANLVICAAVSIILCAVFFASYLCVGIPLLGSFEMDIKGILLYVMTVFLLAVAFTAMFHLIVMLNQNKAITAVVCILTALVLLFAGMQCNKMLSEPETNMGLIMSEGGQEYKEIPNPRYLNEDERKVVQFLYDFIPGGQVVQCVSLEAVNLSRLPVYSLILILASTGAGLFCFRKKDLK